jgi:hypothetical protein
MSTATSAHVVPLVSSGTAGPLGAIHLPRLWSKLTISHAGRLPEGYDDCGSGFDQMTIDGLNLKRERVIDFIRTKKPTYMEFERWVLAENGGSLSQDAIRKHNDAIRGYHHSDELAARMRAAAGVHDDAIKDAVTLNLVEDLDELHAQASKN